MNYHGFPVGNVERCACCSEADPAKLTRHHLFGKGLPYTLRLCAVCHRGYHREADQRKPGRFMAAVMLSAAIAFGKRPKIGYPKDPHRRSKRARTDV